MINRFKNTKKNSYDVWLSVIPIRSKRFKVSTHFRYQKKLNINTGYADHSLTDNIAQTYLLTAKAIDYGANYIEKHVTLSAMKKSQTIYLALNLIHWMNILISLKKYFKQFRKEISLKEEKYCNIMGKFAFSNRYIKKGELINFEKIKFLRASRIGITRHEINIILKNKTISLKNLKEDEILKKKFFRNKKN